MIFRETGLADAWLIEPERVVDERGYSARTWCVDEFDIHGVTTSFVQCHTTFNERRSTLRGLHFQRDPFAEAKLIRCPRGRVWDVMVDLRPESATFGAWRAYELSADNGRAVFVPEGFGHGFQTLEDATEVYFQCSEFFQASHSAGVCWDDPDLGISWPDPDSPILSERDRRLPAFAEVFPARRRIAVA